MSDAFAYDAFEYPSHLYPQAHPSRLAAIARLHGIPAASPKACRLLDVGCGDGLQLLTLAMAYPESTFVGVDLSSAAITRGESMRVKLGLDNLTLVSADLLHWDPGSLPYDYIVAHGFYSWVPESVRARLLHLCEQTLAPAGIAYVSYNALPGCHLRRMVWDMMKFHIRDIDDPGDRVQRSREFLMWLGRDVANEKVYGAAIRAEAERLLNDSHPSVLFHDDLADINTPLMLTEFVEQANSHGLTFLAEADYHEMSDALLPEEAVTRLADISGGDFLRKEQHLDFLKGRRFRQTLLCRRSMPLQRIPLTDSTLGFEVSGHFRSETIDGPGDASRFASSEGAAITTNHPLVKIMLTTIAEAFPATLSAQVLLDRIRATSGNGESAREDDAAITHALLTGFQLGLLTLHSDAPRFALEVTDRPLASSLARLQIEAGNELIASLRPSLVRLDSRPALELIRLLDGTLDHDALLLALAERMASLPITDINGSQTLQPSSWWQEQLAPMLESGLTDVARMGLLVA